MRFLLCRTDGIGDLAASLPVQGCILGEDPSAKIFWLVRQALAPILERLPGVQAVLHRPHDDDLELFMQGQLPRREFKERQRRRPPDAALVDLIRDTRPDALLSLGHWDLKIVEAARMAGVPTIVARPRGWRQFFDATHLVLAKNSDSRRHQSQHNLDFLRTIRWPVPDPPPMPRLALAQEEIERGRADLAGAPAPRLGLVVKGNTGAGPSSAWWEKMAETSKRAGWGTVVLSPPDTASLPPTGIRGLMARLGACGAVLGVSTGPTHLAAALGVPTLCLMGRRALHAPARWAPLEGCGESEPEASVPAQPVADSLRNGRSKQTRVGTMQYEGEEDDLGTGFDRFSHGAVLDCLEKLRGGET
jgi:ADP-heptose:LPS heptosyltransferase